MILESGSDANWSEDRDISAQSDSDSDIDRGDTSDTNFTQWKDNTNCPTVPVQNVPVGYDKQRHSTLTKTLCHWANSCSSILQLYNSWWKRQTDIISSTSICWMKGDPQCLIWQLRTCVCFWRLLWRWGKISRTCWKVTGQQENSTSWPFTKANLKKAWLRTQQTLARAG